MKMAAPMQMAARKTYRQLYFILIIFGTNPQILLPSPLRSDGIKISGENLRFQLFKNRMKKVKKKVKKNVKKNVKKMKEKKKLKQNQNQVEIKINLKTN